MGETSRKSELEFVQQTNRFFEMLLRASVDGVVITDSSQNIIVVNEAFCSFLDQHWRDVIETSLFVWLDQFDDDAPQRWAELEKRVHVEGECRNAGFQKTTANGVRHFSVNASSMARVAHEESGVIVSIWRDVTERKRAEDQLIKRTAELRKTVNLMSGREVRMAGLKKAVDQLRAQLEAAGLAPVADDPLKHAGRGGM